MIRSSGTISPQCQLVSSVEDLTLINNIASHKLMVIFCNVLLKVYSLHVIWLVKCLIGPYSCSLIGQIL